MYNGSMYPRIIHEPLDNQESFFLFGSRGTGKTTWLKQNCHDAMFIDLLETRVYHDLLADPSRINNMIINKTVDWIIIDEIQKVPELLNEVHRLIETKKYKFILTGSSARSLRKKGVNLLAGRALTYNLFPLTSIELGDDFKLDYSLLYGHLPNVFNRKNPKKYLGSYINTYLKEEVLQEGLVRRLNVFVRFIEIASFSQGSIINISHIAREVGLDQKTIENYFSILEDLLIAVRIPVFTRRAKRRLVNHPKFYYFDVGIYRHIRPQGPLDSSSEIEGMSLETLFLQEIRAINSYYGFEYSIYFWRTSNGMEVDFVLYGSQGFMAFEIKRSQRFSNKDFSGLRSFSRDYPEAKLFFLYGGNRKEHYEGINVYPIEWVLRNLQKILANND